MPSFLHEALLLLFDNRPELALYYLWHAFRLRIRRPHRVTNETSEIHGISPHPHQADRVLALRDKRGRVYLILVIEAQTSKKNAKSSRWPLYYSHLRVRYNCKVLLLVIAPSQEVADWARRPIELGQPGSVFTPLVLGPAEIGALTDPTEAQAMPERAVLSALVHARGERAFETAQTALQAVAALDEERGAKYRNVVLSTQVEGNRQKLENAMEIKDWELKGAWARKYYKQGIRDGLREGTREGKAEGRAEGEALGRIEAILAVLEARGLEVPEGVRERVLGCTDLEQLRAWLQRAVSVEDASELFA